MDNRLDQRTLEDFRAEKGIYLKDLATALEISEDELRTIEETGIMPQEIEQKLILQYNLPEDYFSATEYLPQRVITPEISSKATMKFFFNTSLVWGILASLVATIPVSILSAIFKALNMPSISILTHVFTFCSNLILAFSGIFLANYILKKTSFKGNIKKYQFLYPLLPGQITLFIMSISSLSFAMINEKIKTATEFSYTNTLSYIAFSCINLIVCVISIVICAYICARLLKAAVSEDENENRAFLRKIAVITTVSLAISTVVYIIRAVIIDFHLFNMIKTFVSYALCIAVAWLVALVKTENKKSEVLIYTVLPIIALVI